MYCTTLQKYSWTNQSNLSGFLLRRAAYINRKRSMNIIISIRIRFLEHSVRLYFLEYHLGTKFKQRYHNSGWEIWPCSLSTLSSHSVDRDKQTFRSSWARNICIKLQFLSSQTHFSVVTLSCVLYAYDNFQELI